MSKRPAAERARRRSAIAVEIRIGEAALADRIAAMLADRAGIRIAGHDDPHAGVAVTDALPQGGSTPVIVIADRIDMAEAFRAGAAGVLGTAVTPAQLLAAIEAAVHGLAVMPDDMLADWLDIASPDEPGEAGRADDAVALTPRELEVLGLLAAGASNKVIARRLDISVHTVKFHVASILTKLDATGRTDAVAHAVRLGLLML